MTKFTQEILSIKEVYAKGLDSARNSLENAKLSLDNSNLPTELKASLAEKTHQEAFDYVDSVISINLYSRDKQLINQVQADFMQPALDLYNEAFDLYYEYTKDFY